MKVEEELGEFLSKNYIKIHDRAVKFRIASIDVLLGHPFSILFKPLVIIINPGDGYTTAYQENFVESLYKEAGALAGSISVLTSKELEEKIKNGFLTPDEFKAIQSTKESFDDYCGNQNGSMCR